MPLFRLLVAVVAVVALAGCDRPAPNERAAPEAAFTAFRSALAAGAPEAVWSFLDAPTRAALEARAEAARASGVAVEHPAQLLIAGWVPDAADIEEVTRVEETDEAVTLEVRTVHGAAEQVVLYRSDAGWRIALPLSDAS